MSKQASPAILQRALGALNEYIAAEPDAADKAKAQAIIGQVKALAGKDAADAGKKAPPVNELTAAKAFAAKDPRFGGKAPAKKSAPFGGKQAPPFGKKAAPATATAPAMAPVASGKPAFGSPAWRAKYGKKA